MKITVKRLTSGYYYIRGEGVCNWAQSQTWPCSEEVLREHSFQEPSEAFIHGAMAMVDDVVRASRGGKLLRGV